MTCEACAIAKKDPLTGRLIAFCRGCEIRTMSNAPRWLWEQMLDALVDPAERADMLAASTAEYHRRKAFEKGSRGCEIVPLDDKFEA